jgi:hypothetical protein
MGFWGAVAKFFISIGSTFGATGTLGNVIAGITGFLNVTALVVGVKGFMQARQMLAKGQDILLNKTSAGGKIPLIYGSRRVGSQIVYMDVNSNDSRDLYVVYALAVGECEEILGQTIELDGTPLTDSARFRDGGYIGTDKIASGNGSLNTVSQNGTGINAGAGGFGTSPTSKYRYVMNLHHGAASQNADPMLVASMSNWTSAHKLNGICYIAAHYGYDKKGIWSGVPQLTVQVKGKKVFDPRDNSQTFGNVSTYTWSDNPALTFLDYITNDEYGKGIPQSKINTTTFSTAANTADTLVDNPFYNGSAKTFSWSGVAGNNFITVQASQTNGTLRWWSNKVGEVLTLTDASGNTVVNALQITAIQRYRAYGGSIQLRIYFNGTLPASYSVQTGTSLAKVKRFHCNGYVDTNKNVMDNAKELLANMRGVLLYINGQYELSIEDTGSSTFTITDDHVIQDAGISVDYGNKDKKANKVIVEFFNGSKDYELDTATVLHSATTDANDYTSDDGNEVLEIKAEFPYISDHYIAYNMAKAILTRSRYQTTVQFLGTPEMYKLNVNDIVTLSYTGLGFSSKVFRVEGLELNPNGLVAVSLIEYFDVYTWTVPPQEPLEEHADLPSAYAVAAPTGLSFTDTDASSTGRPFLAWNEPTDYPNYQYRVNVVDSAGNQVVNKIVDVTNCDLIFVPVDANYVASVTSLNVLGSESSAATLTFTIGNAPTGTTDIKDGSIVTDKLPDATGTSDGVTGAKIANLAITNAKINDLNATKINAGTIDTNRLDVSGIITAGSIIVTGSNISELNNNSGFVDASGAASAAPVQSVAGSTGAVSASTIISAGNIIVQNDNISQLNNNSGFITGSAVNSNVTNISGGAIQTGTVAAARIDVSGVISAGSLLTTTATISNSLNVGSGTFTVDSSGNVVATSVTVTGKYNAKNITGNGQAGLFSTLSPSLTGGSEAFRVLNPSDDNDVDFFILMGQDPYTMSFSGGNPASTNKGLWFTGGGTVYLGHSSISFSPLADNTNDLGRASNRWDDIYATNGTIQTSDANDKSNIADSDLGLSFVSKLTPRKYTLIDGDSNRTHYGLIAQEVKTVLDDNNINTSDFAPYIEGEILDTNDQGTGQYKYGLRYTELISILIKSIQELEQRIKNLEN